MIFPSISDLTLRTEMKNLRALGRQEAHVVSILLKLLEHHVRDAHTLDGARVLDVSDVRVWLRELDELLVRS